MPDREFGSIEMKWKTTINMAHIPRHASRASNRALSGIPNFPHRLDSIATNAAWKSFRREVGNVYVEVTSILRQYVREVSSGVML